MSERLIITPKTKIRELIDAYPEVEETLIEMAPAFSKLKNPVLRNTVARVTSLNQAALIGNINISYMVNCLRKRIGQKTFDINTNPDTESMKTTPEWFNEDKVALMLDARPMLEAGHHPIAEVFENLGKLENGSIFKLVTTFTPAPLMDKAREKAFLVFSKEETKGLFHTYFYKQ